MKCGEEGQPEFGAASLKAFLDTAVLIAAFYDGHAHSLLEVYSNLTGLPGKLRVSPDEAMLFVANIGERLTILALTEEDDAELLQWSATNRASQADPFTMLL
jgi:hypothetical protein